MPLFSNLMKVESNGLSLKNFPRFICPICSIGVLRIVKDSVCDKFPGKIARMPKEPTEYYNEDGEVAGIFDQSDIYETEQEVYNTTLFMKCDNDECMETVTSCGVTRYYQYPIEEDDNYGTVYDCGYEFYPKVIWPTVSLFDVPKETPEEVVIALEESFSLIWLCPSACSNSIRKTVERILDKEQDKSYSYRNLHSRIELLEVNNDISKMLKEYLLACKWIGNSGAHESDVKFSDCITAFKILSKCLDLLYRNDELDNVVSAINEYKGPPSKH